jgi:hypothetical protein
MQASSTAMPVPVAIKLNLTSLQVSSNLRFGCQGQALHQAVRTALATQQWQLHNLPASLPGANSTVLLVQHNLGQLASGAAVPDNTGALQGAVINFASQQESLFTAKGTTFKYNANRKFSTRSVVTYPGSNSSSGAAAPAWVLLEYGGRTADLRDCCAGWWYTTADMYATYQTDPADPASFVTDYVSNLQGGYVHSPGERGGAAMAALPDGTAVLFGGFALQLESPGVQTYNDMHMIRLRPPGTAPTDPTVSLPGQEYAAQGCSRGATLVFGLSAGDSIDYYLDSADGWRWNQDEGYTSSYVAGPGMYARSVDLLTDEYVINTTASDLKVVDHAGRLIDFTATETDAASNRTIFKFAFDPCEARPGGRSPSLPAASGFAAESFEVQYYNASYAPSPRAAAAMLWMPWGSVQHLLAQEPSPDGALLLYGGTADFEGALQHTS